MAPARKSRSLSKRISSVNEESPSNDGQNPKKSMQRKRKLGDMLGSQWSKTELERFYEAYRKYGKDWKKVAAAVRNRSVEMVEALYMTNKAYLSLPEGTASVVGLIAMMTDHYSAMIDSDSEQESNDGGATSRKPQKRGRGKVRTSYSKGSDGKLLSHSQTAATNFDCLSLLKKKHTGESRPRAVGKRTPRFPVSRSYEKVSGGRFFSPTRQRLKPKADANDDNVEHEAALALAEASQRGGSPQVSQTPSRRSGNGMSSPIWSGERMGTEMELTSAKLRSDTDEESLEGSLEVGNKGDFFRVRHFLMETEGAAGTAVMKGRRIHGKKSDIDSISNRLDDIKEACGRTEGQNFGVKVGKNVHHMARKKSKKALFSGDEESALDALQTLADLSLMMPVTAIENESSVHVKEDNLTGQNELLEKTPAIHQRDRTKSSGVKAKGNLAGNGASVAKTSRLGKVVDVSDIPEIAEEPEKSTSRLSRKNQKMFISHVRRTDLLTHTHLNEEAETKNAENKLTTKGKRSPVSQQQKGWNLVTNLEHSSSAADVRAAKDESAPSTAHDTVANEVTLPSKVRRRRKTELRKPQKLKDLNKFINADSSNLSKSVHGALNLKDMLSNCLSNYRVRRWCANEWFYSAIDYPWFAKREFVEYLNHVGLGHVPRLTRVEWGVIRSSLGKPRRFSEQFLKEEKDKLIQYRDSVRNHYTELREGTREGLPTDLARPLSVGQRVMAIHPKLREIYDGKVLTVDNDRCRVQFDRPELGVEFVLDIDCMPMNPIENMPASLAINTVNMDKLFASFNKLKMNARAKDHKIEGSMKISSAETFKHIDVPSHVSPAYALSNLLKQAKEIPINSNFQANVGINQAAQQVVNSAVLAHMQAKDADVQALAELTRALEKKEAVVSELKHMNDDVSENQRVGDSSLRESETFKKQYAAVLVQLDDVNDQVSRALLDLRQRNTYHSSPPAWPKSMTIRDSVGPLNSFNQQVNHVQESRSHVHEIVDSSRRKAQTMVDAAMQAMSSLEVGDTSIKKKVEAMDYISNRLSLDDAFAGFTRSFNSTNPVNGNLPSPCRPELELENVLDRDEGQIPSELISHCVATLLMIQRCTERQFPPSDVAQIIDHAVISLQPSWPENLSLYAEIQKCMGIIKNQILALIPT